MPTAARDLRPRRDGWRRRGHLAALLASITLGFLGASASGLSLRAPVPGSYQPHTVTIPAEALPRGPATLEVVGVSGAIPILHHIEVLGDTETVVRSWAFPQSDGAVPIVLVRSASGEEWSGAVVWEREPRALPTPRFVGTSEDFAGFVDALSALTPSSSSYGRFDPEETFHYVAPDASLDPDCSFSVRQETWKETWVAARPEPALAEALLVCAARGASILLLQDGASDVLPGLAAATLYPWGEGLVVTAPPEAEAAATAFRVLREGPYPATRLDDFVADVGGERDRRRSAYDPLVFPVAPLVVFALVVAPAGYLVARRPRKTWVAWTWLPGLALAAALGLWARGAADAPAEDARLILLSVEGPGTSGFERQSLWLNAPTSQRFEARVPWAGRDVDWAVRMPRLGSPFRTRYPHIEIATSEDGKTMRLAGLGTGSPSLSLQQEGRAPFFRVERRGDEYAIEPLTSRAVEEVVLRTRRRVVVFDVAAGRPRAVETRASAPRWAKELMGAVLPEGAYLLAARLSEDPEARSAFEVEPALPLRVEHYVVQAGPSLPEDTRR